MNNGKYAENLIKMKSLYNLKCKAYPREKLEYLKQSNNIYSYLD